LVPMTNAQRKEIVAAAAAHGRELRRLSHVEGTPEHAQRCAVEYAKAVRQLTMDRARGKFGYGL
jgi:hypothetical protein